jgi:hypothetical protein
VDFRESNLREVSGVSVGAGLSQRLRRCSFFTFLAVNANDSLRSGSYRLNFFRNSMKRASRSAWIGPPKLRKTLKAAAPVWSKN